MFLVSLLVLKREFKSFHVFISNWSTPKKNSKQFLTLYYMIQDNRSPQTYLTEGSDGSMVITANMQIMSFNKCVVLCVREVNKLH